MYHRLARTSRGKRYVVSEVRFLKQMRWLKRNGYQVIALDELVGSRPFQTTSQLRQVIITFDDGYEDTYQLACPILATFGFAATFFLVGDRVGKRNQWDRCGEECAGAQLLNWDDAAWLVNNGFTVGSHSLTHPDLTKLSLDEAVYEIGQSKVQIESAVGCTVKSFAFPYGRQNKNLRDIVRSMGYLASCVTQPGFNDAHTDVFALRRIEICGTDSLRTFGRKLTFGMSEFRSSDLLRYYASRIRKRLLVERG